MSEQDVKHLKTRIIHKHDIADNWNKAEGFIPKQGELIIYDDRTLKTVVDENGKEHFETDQIKSQSVKYKIGDGVRSVKDLPLIGAGHAGEGLNAEIFNDYDQNLAISNYSSARGLSTQAGGKGFTVNLDHYYSKLIYDENDAVDYTNSTRANIDADIDTEDSTKGTYYFTSVEGIEVGLEYSMQLSNNFDFNGFVEAVDSETNSIKVTNFILPNSSTTGSGINKDTVFWFPSKPNIGTRAIGEAASTEGYGAVALQDYSHAEGRDTIASGKYSHAEGRLTRAAYGAHAEGYKSKADAYCSHAEGATTLADEMYAHAEGSTTKALGISSHAEGDNTEASGRCSHAQGSFSRATGFASHAGGDSSRALADYAYAFGLKAVANKPNEYVIGRYNVVDYSSKGWGRLFVIGNGTDSSNRSDAFTVYDDGRAAIGAIEPVNDNDVISNKYFQNTLIEVFKYYKNWEDTENYISTSLEPYNVWENTKTYIDTGLDTVTKNSEDFATIEATKSYNDSVSWTRNFVNSIYSIGNNAIQWATDKSFSIGTNNNMACDKGCVTIGYNNTVSVRDENRNILPGEGSTSIGCGSKVTAAKAYALGSYCIASASGAVAIGQSSQANGSASFAGGYSAIADGRNSVAIGRLTKASADYQTVIGRANVPVTSSKAVLVVGTGMQDTQRSNGMILWEDGRLEIGADPTADMEVATKRYVDSRPTSDIGKKGESKGSEYFNDYENLTVLGEYASAHGKSSTSYSSITTPDKLYYKTLLDTNSSDDNVTETTVRELMSSASISMNPEFEYIELILNTNDGSYNGCFDVRIVGENYSFYLCKDFYGSNEAKIYYSEIVENWESAMDSEVASGNARKELEWIEIDFLGQSPDVSIYKVSTAIKQETPYDFESLQFTTDSTNVLGTVDKVYQYQDKWGNTRYTLWQDYHPDWTGVEEPRWKLLPYQREYRESGEYQIRFTEEYKKTENYLKIYNGQYCPDISIYEASDYFNDPEMSYGLSHDICLTDPENGIIELTVVDETNEDYWHGVWIDYLKEGIADVYKYSEKTADGELVTEAPTDDPIYKTIAYEAITNGGAKFSLTNGTASATFGNDAVTNGQGAFASGVNSLATANYTVSIGKETLARALGAVAFGLEGKATGMYSFAVNEKGIASGYASAVFGDHCVSTNYYSFSGGYKTASHGSSAMAFGAMSTANGTNSLSFGDQTVTNGRNSMAFGFKSTANGMNSFTAGYNNQANGENSIALGMLNIVDGKGAAIGENNNVTTNSYAYGRNNQISGANGSVGLGNKNIVTANNGAVAIGENNKVTAPESAYALGVQCEVIQRGAVAIGNMAKAKGSSSVAIGYNADAIGSNSVAIGRWTKAYGDYQTVIGRANKTFDKSAVLIVGIGMQDDERANGLVVWEDGRVQVGADPVDRMDAATKYYVDSNRTAAIESAKTYTDTTVETAINNIKPQNLLDFETAVLPAGQTELTVKLPLHTTPMMANVTKTDGEVIIVDTTMRVGTYIDYPIDVNMGVGGPINLLITFNRDITLDEHLVSLWADEFTMYNGEYGGQLGDVLGRICQLSSNQLLVEAGYSRKNYPDYGVVEGDYIENCDAISFSADCHNEDIQSIVKFTYPTVNISIAEPFESDVNISILYRKDSI